MDFKSEVVSLVAGAAAGPFDGSEALHFIQESSLNL